MSKSKISQTMIIKKTFEEWLQGFNQQIRIMENDNNGDIDVLYFKDERLCSVPKGLKASKFWTDVVNNRRGDSGYTTSDGIAHRSLSGIGIVLLSNNLITKSQFIKHFSLNNKVKSEINKIIR